MSDLFARMSARPLPVETVPLPADRQEWDVVHAEWEASAAAVAEAAASGPPPPTLVARRQAAEDAMDALETIEWRIQALPGDEWEELIGEHPAVTGATHGWPFEPRTFLPAVLAVTASCEGEQLTEDQWRTLLGGVMGQGERTKLFDAVVQVNVSTPVISAAVGKGSAQTRS